MKRTFYFDGISKSILTMICFFFLQQGSFAQVSGNQVFSSNRDNYSYYGRIDTRLKQTSDEKIYLTDSSILVQAKIIKNVKADHFICVFGLNEIAKTVGTANTNINARIKNFIENIKKAGINEQDIYTDMVTQYRIYEYQRNKEGEIEDFLKGFELNKNIIIKYYKPTLIDKILTIAANDSILDLIKVDYVVEDIEKVYEEIFQTASEVTRRKKDIYLKLIGGKAKPNVQIYNSSFASYYPIEMYKNYQAFSTNTYDSYWGSDRKKTARKFTTYYYDRLDYSGFDKVVNPSVLEPVVQFTLTLQVVYNLEPKMPQLPIMLNPFKVYPQ